MDSAQRQSEGWVMHAYMEGKVTHGLAFASKDSYSKP